MTEYTRLELRIPPLTIFPHHSYVSAYYNGSNCSRDAPAFAHAACMCTACNQGNTYSQFELKKDHDDDDDDDDDDDNNDDDDDDDDDDDESVVDTYVHIV